MDICLETNFHAQNDEKYNFISAYDIKSKAMFYSCHTYG